MITILTIILIALIILFSVLNTLSFQKIRRIAEKEAKVDEMSKYYLEKAYGPASGTSIHPPTYIFTQAIACGTTISLLPRQSLEKALNQRGMLEKS